MKALSSRLARLERTQARSKKRTRCADCRDWPDVRILNIDAAASVIPITTMDAPVLGSALQDD